MKARLPKYDPKAQDLVRELFADEIQKARDEASYETTGKNILLCCAALHTRKRDPYGEKRLADYLIDLQEFCSWGTGKYDDAAVYKALQILEDDCPGIKWRDLLGIEVSGGNDND